MLALFTEVRTRTIDSSNKDHVHLETAFNQAARASCSQLQEFAEKHQKLTTLLRERIHFCTEKLNAVRLPTVALYVCVCVCVCVLD